MRVTGMTSMGDVELECYCGHAMNARLYNSINITLHPDFIDDIFQGRFHVMKCPECGQESFVKRPFLFHDMELNIMYYVGSDKVDQEIMDTMVQTMECVVIDGSTCDIEQFIQLQNKIENQQAPTVYWVGCGDYTSFLSFMHTVGYFDGMVKEKKKKSILDRIAGLVLNR